MHIFTALVLLLAPLLPADIPANMIYMGQGIEPIHSIKIKRGFVSDGRYMLITPYNFIRVKSALENSPDLCTLAISETVKSCTAGLEREQQIMLNREHDDAKLLTAYESRLKAIESDLQNSEYHNKMLMYITGGFALLSTASITFALIR